MIKIKMSGKPVREFPLLDEVDTIEQYDGTVALIQYEDTVIPIALTRAGGHYLEAIGQLDSYMRLMEYDHCRKRIVYIDNDF